MNNLPRDRNAAQNLRSLGNEGFLSGYLVHRENIWSGSNGFFRLAGEEFKAMIAEVLRQGCKFWPTGPRVQLQIEFALGKLSLALDVVITKLFSSRQC